MLIAESIAWVMLSKLDVVHKLASSLPSRYVHTVYLSRGTYRGEVDIYPRKGITFIDKDADSTSLKVDMSSKSGALHEELVTDCEIYEEKYIGCHWFLSAESTDYYKIKFEVVGDIYRLAESIRFAIGNNLKDSNVGIFFILLPLISLSGLSIVVAGVLMLAIQFAAIIVYGLLVRASMIAASIKQSRRR